MICIKVLKSTLGTDPCLTPADPHLPQVAHTVAAALRKGDPNLYERKTYCSCQTMQEVTDGWEDLCDCQRIYMISECEFT